MHLKIYSFFIIIFFVSNNLSANDLTLQNFNELKIKLTNNEITIEHFNEKIHDFNITSDIFEISKSLFLEEALSLEDYLEVIENLLISENSLSKRNDSNDFKENIISEINLKLKIVKVNVNVPTELAAKINNIEKLTLLMDADKVKEIEYEEKLNNFFTSKNIRSFKNIKIKLTNKKILKGKSRVVIKQFSSENVSIYWNIDLSSDDPSGNVIIELVGRGPQIELIPTK